MEFLIELIGQRLVLRNLPHPKSPILIHKVERIRVVGQENEVRQIRNRDLTFVLLIDFDVGGGNKLLNKFNYVLLVPPAVNFVSNDELFVQEPRIEVAI